MLKYFQKKIFIVTAWIESSTNKNLNKLLVGKNNPNWSLSLHSFRYFLRIKLDCIALEDSHFDWQIYVPRQFHLPHNSIRFLPHFLQAQVQLSWKWDTLCKFVILQATWHWTRRNKLRSGHLNKDESFTCH